MRSRPTLLILSILIALIVSVAFNVWLFEAGRPSGGSSDATPASESTVAQQTAASSSGSGKSSSDLAPTDVYAHNLMLRKGPNFRIYVRWLRGEMKRSRRDVNPSFDNPDSFFLDIKTGVIRANIGDIAHFLNTSVTNAPLKDIQLSGDGDQIKLQGTLHKLISLPIAMTGTISAVPPSQIRIRVTKLSVLKVPLKGLLGAFNVSVSDLFDPHGIPGIQVNGNDILFDTQTLLPPPHLQGQLTKVRIVNPDLEEVYGNAEKDVERVEQWRNFLRFHNGTIDFGKLTMHQVDIIMIDISKDYWFDLDLAQYQKQLVNGYTHITPDAGLQIFMPDLSQLPKDKATQNIGIEWFKNRNIPPPASVRSR